MHARIALTSVLFWCIAGAAMVVGTANATLNAQEPVVFSGHNGAVMMAEFVQGTGRVVTASADQTAGLWDVATGKRIQTFAQHTGPLYSLAVSKDGRTLVTGAQDNTLRVWDLPMAQPLVRHAELNLGLTDLSLAPDGRSLIMTTSDGQVRTLDLSTNPAVAGSRSGHGPEATCATWRSDGSVFATGDSSGRIILWSPDLETPLSILSAHQSPITSLQFVNGNQQMMSLSADGSARTWQLMTPPARMLHTADSMLVNMVAIPSQNQVLVVTDRGALRILNSQTGEVVRELPALATPATRIAVSPNGALIFCGHADGRISIVSLADGAVTGQLAGHDGAVTDIAPLGDSLSLYSSSVDGTARRWKSAPAPIVQKGHATPIRDVRIAPSKQWTITIGDDGVCRTWNASGGQIAQTTLHTASVRSVAIRDDALVATGDVEGNVWLWNPTNGTAEGYVKAHAGSVQAISFSSEPATVITTGADGLIRSWMLPLPKSKPAEGEIPPKPLWELTTPDGQNITEVVTASPQNRLGLTASGNSIIRFRTTGELDAAVPAPEGPIRRLAVSDKGLLAILRVNGDVCTLNDDLSVRRKLVTLPNAISLRWDRDGLRLLVCDGTEQVRILDAENGRVQEQLKVPAPAMMAEWNSPEQRSITAWGTTGDGQIVSQALSALWDSGAPGPSFLYPSNDGQTVWVADGSGKASLRSATDGKIAKTVETNSPAAEFTASSNGQLLALATADRHVRTYRSDGTLLKELIVPSDVCCLSLNADGSRLLAGLADGSLQVFEPTTGDLLETFRDHTSTTAVRSVRFASDNLTVLSCGDDRTVRLQKCSSFKVAKAGSGQREATLIPASGTQSLHVTTEGKVVLMNLQNGNVDREFKLPAPMNVTALAIRPDGQRVAAGTSTGEIVVWNLNNGDMVLQTVKTTQPVSSLFWSSDSRRLTAVGSELMELFGPSLPNVQPAIELVPYQQIACSHRIRRAMFSGDGRTMFVGLENGAVEEWACAAPEQRRQFNHGGPVYGVAISADGNTVVSCSTDQTVRVWDVVAGQQKFQLNGHQGAVHSVAMNPDESLAVSSGADGTLRLWDIVGGRQLKQLITFNATMYSVTIHPAGQIIAAAGADRKVHLVDLTTGAEIRTMTGHTDFVHSVAFSSDGSQLMSYGYAGQLKIWNTADGSLARETRRGRVGNSARYSFDGQKIVIGNGDGTASVFGAGLQ